MTQRGLQWSFNESPPKRSLTAALSLRGNSSSGHTSVTGLDFHRTDDDERLRGDPPVIKPHAVDIEAWRIHSKPRRRPVGHIPTILPFPRTSSCPAVALAEKIAVTRYSTPVMAIRTPIRLWITRRGS